MKSAVFLDRDGTIIAGTRYIRHEKEVRLLPGTAKGIRILNKAGFLVLIHTNQADIARGKLTEKKLERIHQTLLRRLQKRGAKIDAIYYCPHHPRGKIQKYAIVCSCRKPKAGIFRKAIKEFNVDPKKSFSIGDSSRDILAAKRAGIKTILVETGKGGKDNLHKTSPNFISKNILEAAELIKKMPRKHGGK